MSNTREWRIPIASDATTAIFMPAESVSRIGTLVCAHGAGGHLGDRGMLKAGQAMLDAGLSVVRFNFLYKEHKSGRPDSMPKLMDTVATVAEYARRELGPGPMYLGGRSMGGRAASMLAAGGYDTAGLVLLAYPLHPPDQPEKLRDAHLPSITTPVLCFNGTRDEFCRRDLMEPVLARVKPTFTMHWIDAADHSFHVLKKSGRTDAEVMAEVTETTRTWLGRLAG